MLLGLSNTVFPRARADIVIPPLDNVSFQGLGGVSGSALDVCGAGYLFDRSHFRTRAVQANEGSACPCQHGQRLQHDLGDLQDLSVHAGEISRDPLGADRRLHGVLFHGAST